MSKMKEINLGAMKGPVIDLFHYQDGVRLYGAYYGGPLIIKNGQPDQQIIVEEAAIVSTDGFAIKILNSHAFDLRADNLQVVGGIQVVGNLQYLGLDGVHVRQGDVGLHMTQHKGTEQYGNILIRNSSFCDCDNEGVYIGKYKADDPDKDIFYHKTEEIFFEQCDFLRNGYDGGQFAHAKKVTLHGCVAVKNGTRQEEWHNKNVIFNSGVTRADLIDCTIEWPIEAKGTTQLFFNNN